MKTVLAVALLALGQEDRYGTETPIFYRAEKALWDFREQKVLFDDQIGNFLDEVYEDPWFKQKFPRAKKPKYAVGKYKDKAYSNGDTLYFVPYKDTGKPVSTNYNVLHEMTHQLAPGHNHDRVFAMTYAVLVHHFVGQDSLELLAESYRKNGRPGWVPKISYGK